MELKSRRVGDLAEARLRDACDHDLPARHGIEGYGQPEICSMLNVFKRLFAMAQQGTKLLRMRDVCARTGLARSTIHHYIREGVLPKPEKTGRNTAWYDEDFVKRAQLV